MSEKLDTNKKKEENGEALQIEENKNKDTNTQKIKDSEPEKKPIQTVRSYLEENNVIKILQEGLLEIEKTRPSDPVQALGQYLIDHSKSKEV